ncbi:MAG TPA: DUF6512 family protein [Anaerolineaceae bacterium]|nr:DUF6512 family protein [Anaerolineaceae bacterium]
MIKKFPFLLKILLIQLIYSLLHFLYDWFPNSFTAIFSGIDDSIYQHMKMCFYSYIIFALLEYALTRKSLVQGRQFLFSRLFSATYFPLVMVIIYLFAPLVFGRMESIALEVIYANIALFVSSSFTLVVEDQLEKTKPGSLFILVTVTLFVISLVQYITFTYKLPWIDIFSIPPPR